MRSLLGPLLNQAPVPLAMRRSNGGAMLGAGSSTAGFETQLRSFTTNGTVNGIVSRTSTAVSQVEWHLYRKSKTGKPEDRKKVTEHAAWDLWTKPNPFMPRQEFVEVAQQHIDLAGESPWVVAYDKRAKTLPLELWPVRPDRMEPDPDPKKFLLGWQYRSPEDGKLIPLGLKEVIHLRTPNPLDPFRGCSPIATLLITLGRSRAAAEWNRNFFANSARPGGIIQVDKRLSDDEFDELVLRWNEQHRGVGNAHKVAVLEQGQWKEIGFSIKDLQVTELRESDRDEILEAFGFPRPLLGIDQDSNRAAAQAAEYIFAKWLTVPRLERIRGALNHDLLPLYGDTSKDFEFDFDSPVPADDEAENASRDSRVAAAVALIAQGADPEATLKAFDLPALPFSVAVAAPQAPPREQTTPDDTTNAQFSRIVANLVRNAADEDTPPEPDLSAVDVAWSAALAALLAQWTAVVADWIVQLIEQVRSILRSGSTADLATLKVNTSTAVGLLQSAQHQLGETAARQVVAEALEQDVDLTAVYPTREDYAPDATLTVNLLARGLETSAAREVQRIAGPDPDVDEVIAGVRTHLESATDAEPKRVLGGALHGSINAGRASTLAAGPVGAIYATETLDSATCGPCREIDGRWICDTDDLTALYKLYPLAGYLDCEGGIRCRGTFTGVWRAQTGKETS
ncbi:phage portal protein [Lentzea sp. NPDC092896]|uniref:phage portal protein n=1 Tax=Lentzea sp. NPDC092896 TaxID=3364127 RepID=UPI0038205FA4